jgi:hypothetical protein
MPLPRERRKELQILDWQSRDTCESIPGMQMTWQEQRRRMREWALLWNYIGDRTYLKVAIYWRDCARLSALHRSGV